MQLILSTYVYNQHLITTTTTTTTTTAIHTNMMIYCEIMNDVQSMYATNTHVDNSYDRNSSDFHHTITTILYYSNHYDMILYFILCQLYTTVGKYT